ncbi:ABC transporter permease, partial [Acidovorax sp. HMWF029]|uniref:ABC transporter permease n=1 Tax=Acidovorax sp. HMWF029 TaxID=2056863 RepID=UPI000D4E1429
TGLQQRVPVQVAGTVAAGGAPLAVMDIGAAQDLFGRQGALTRIDLQLQPGTDAAAWQRTLRADPGWPANAVLAQPGDAAQRISNLSRAYRVNLTVLALVALFTGAFLVFSVLALSVAQRGPQFALLAVLGATPRQRLLLVLAESAALGLLGSVLGIALGTALAATALQLLGGDLGGGYFAGVQPALQWSAPAALMYGALGVAAALAGGWWPARAAQQLPPAQTLKGLGTAASQADKGTVGLVLLAGGALLALAPPVGGVPLAAYVAIGLLLVGGIALLPWGMARLLAALQPLAARHTLPLLALERARRMRGSAAIAVGGVVASLSLAVALTVMVASFRGSVTQWLDAVLPSPLYVRSALSTSGTTGTEAALLPAGFAEAVAQLPGVERVQS